MSIRESRLCDSPRGFGENEDLCPLPSRSTCPVCRQDRCDAHIGVHEVCVVVNTESLHTPPHTKLLGHAKFRVCEMCLKTLRTAKDNEHVIDAAALTEPLCVLLAAAITADALETKTP